MKKILLALGIALLAKPVCANEVEEIHGQKVVMLHVSTAEEVHRISGLEISREEKSVQLGVVMQKELVLVEGEESFCETAAKVYSGTSRSWDEVMDRCISALESRDFIDDIASGGLEDAGDDIAEIRSRLSQFLKLLITL